tara:strand:+ start:82 stop:414 length:333 start_codon:yes stop_codon:yes gene_type:complete
MAVYEVLNDSNEVVNTIAADEQFMAANHDNYRLVPAPDTSEKDGRAWRDAELARTDIIAQTPDWPDRDDWLTYRTTLRNWPSTDSFPATRPNDPDYVAPETGGGSPPPPE